MLVVGELVNVSTKSVLKEVVWRTTRRSFVLG